MYSFQEKYEAVLRKDSSFEGLFFTAVKTTGIFCRPTCSAKKPKPENIVFYDSVKEALLNGFRPCRICKPMEEPEAVPPGIQKIIDELNEDPFRKINDLELRRRNIDPAKVRRWFKKNHNLTFHAYRRMIRLNNAFNKIAEGEKVTGAAFDSGYESLSGFNHSYQVIFGTSPAKSKGKIIINLIRFSTPLGPMFACATKEGICLAEFTDRRMLERELKDLQRLLNGVILPGSNIHLDQLQSEMKEYFEGKRKKFTVKLVTPGTQFQKAVWQVLTEIPYGETRSYKQQAEKLKKPEAVRAVAGANGCNRIAVVIPCHRVIGENGSLTGYAGGLSRKKWLLDFEKYNSGKSMQTEFNFDFNFKTNNPVNSRGFT